MFSYAQEIFGRPCHISPEGFKAYQPTIQGMLQGFAFEKKDEPENSVPFFVSNQTGEVVQMVDTDEETQQKVVHILVVRGVMTKHDQDCGPRGMRTIGNRLRRAEKDECVVGHIIVFETPGGTGMSVPEISEAIEECKKPVLGLIDGCCCSAGMFAISYTDEIWATRETDTVGSIGTMITYQGRKTISPEDSNQVVQVTVYAEDSPEKNEEWEAAINNNEFDLTHERILKPANDHFRSEIKRNRPNATDAHLKGRTWDAKDVMDILVDRIGSFSDAVQRVAELADEQSGDDGNSNSSQSTEITNKEIGGMPNYSNVNAVLGVDSMEQHEGHVSLNDEQMQALDDALGQNSQAGTDLTAEQTAHANTKQELQTANETIATLRGTSGADSPQVNTGNNGHEGGESSLQHVMDARKMYEILPDN